VKEAVGAPGEIPSWEPKKKKEEGARLLLSNHDPSPEHCVRGNGNGEKHNIDCESEPTQETQGESSKQRDTKDSIVISERGSLNCFWVREKSLLLAWWKAPKLHRRKSNSKAFIPMTWLCEGVR